MWRSSRLHTSQLPLRTATHCSRRRRSSLHYSFNRSALVVCVPTQPLTAVKGGVPAVAKVAVLHPDAGALVDLHSLLQRAQQRNATGSALQHAAALQRGAHEGALKRGAFVAPGWVALEQSTHQHPAYGQHSIPTCTLHSPGMGWPPGEGLQAAMSGQMPDTVTLQWGMHGQASAAAVGKCGSVDVQGSAACTRHVRLLQPRAEPPRSMLVHRTRAGGAAVGHQCTHECPPDSLTVSSAGWCTARNGTHCRRPTGT